MAPRAKVSTNPPTWQTALAVAQCIFAHAGAGSHVIPLTIAWSPTSIGVSSAEVSAPLRDEGIIPPLDRGTGRVGVSELKPSMIFGRLETLPDQSNAELDGADANGPPSSAGAGSTEAGASGIERMRLSWWSGGTVAR
jgi:hypothetical protein